MLASRFFNDVFHHGRIGHKLDATLVHVREQPFPSCID